MEDPDPDPNIASLMGFSAFGSQPKPKKQKPNPKEAGKSNSTKKSSGRNTQFSSGANSVPLPIKTKGGSPALDAAQQGPLDTTTENRYHGQSATNTDDSQETSIQPFNTSTTAATISQNTHPAPVSGLYQAPPTLTGKSTSPIPTSNPLKPEKEQEQTPHPTTIPASGPSAIETTKVQPGKRPDGTWDLEALRRGIRDENGDMVVYMPSFVEDPWAGFGV